MDDTSKMVLAYIRNNGTVSMHQLIANLAIKEDGCVQVALLECWMGSLFRAGLIYHVNTITFGMLESEIMIEAL